MRLEAHREELKASGFLQLTESKWAFLSLGVFASCPLVPRSGRRAWNNGVLEC
jgi:hypothetical protein